MLQGPHCLGKGRRKCKPILPPFRIVQVLSFTKINGNHSNKPPNRSVRLSAPATLLCIGERRSRATATPGRSSRHTMFPSFCNTVTQGRQYPDVILLCRLWRPLVPLVWRNSGFRPGIRPDIEYLSSGAEPPPTWKATALLSASVCRRKSGANVSEK